jgi:hypothetical protein
MTMAFKLCFFGAGFAAATAIIYWKLGMIDQLTFAALWSVVLLFAGLSPGKAKVGE